MRHRARSLTHGVPVVEIDASVVPISTTAWSALHAETTFDMQMGGSVVVDIAKWIRLQWDRVLAWVLIAAGVGALIAGWVGVSGDAYTAGQLPYIISGGIGGIFLLGLGATLWLSADLRDEWRKLDRIEDAMVGRGAGVETGAAHSD